MNRAPSALLPDADALFIDTPVLAEDGSISGEELLWLAVVATAWRDAFVISDVGILNSDRACDPELVRSEARRWLTFDFGDWAEDRFEICARAGVDEKMLRNAAKRRLQEIKTGEKTAQVVSLDTMFTELLDRSDGMDAAALDSALAALANLENAA